MLIVNLVSLIVSLVKEKYGDSEKPTLAIQNGGLKLFLEKKDGDFLMPIANLAYLIVQKEVSFGLSLNINITVSESKEPMVKTISSCATMDKAHLCYLEKKFMMKTLCGDSVTMICDLNLFKINHKIYTFEKEKLIIIITSLSH